MPQSCFRQGATPQRPRLHFFSFPVRSPAARCAAMPQRRCRAALLPLGQRRVATAGRRRRSCRTCRQRAAQRRHDGRSNRRHRRRSVAAVQYSGVADSRRHAGRKLRRRACSVALGGNGPDANHAGSVGCFCVPATAWAPIHMMRTTTSWPVRRISPSCWIVWIPGFLAAYNAGPARYEDHLATGRVLTAVTQVYVTDLAPVIGGGAIDDATVVNAVVRSWTEAPLFVVPAESSPKKSPASSDPR